MSVFFNTEMNFVPDFYFDDETAFLKNCIKSTSYLCGLFNAGLQIAFYGGLCDSLLMFEKNDFFASNINYSDQQKILFIFLPYPKNYENSNYTYLNNYCLPYIQTKNSIKPLGLYAIQTFYNSPVQNIIKFYRNSEFDICYNKTLCEKNIFETLCNIIFK